MKRNYVWIYPKNYIFERMLSKVDKFERIKRAPFDLDKPFKQKDKLFEPFDNTKAICFIVVMAVFNKYREELIWYVKRNFPEAKLVLWIGDISEKLEKYYKLDHSLLTENFDIIVSFDREDAQRNNYLYYRAFFDDFELSNNTLFDIAFVGGAKSRYKELIELYLNSLEQGYKSSFYILGVPKEDQIYARNITYLDDTISFDMNLEIMSKSRCIVSFIQDGGYSIDIRFLESIYLGKHFITNCKEIFEKPEFFEYNRFSHLYQPGMSLDFLEEDSNDGAMKLKAQSYFSSISFIAWLDERLD